MGQQSSPEQVGVLWSSLCCMAGFACLICGLVWIPRVMTAQETNEHLVEAEAGCVIVAWNIVGESLDRAVLSVLVVLTAASRRLSLRKRQARVHVLEGMGQLLVFACGEQRAALHRTLREQLPSVRLERRAGKSPVSVWLWRDTQARASLRCRSFRI
jgi:hypothetical protein